MTPCHHHQAKSEHRIEAPYSDRRMNENIQGVKIHPHSQPLSKQFGKDGVRPCVKFRLHVPDEEHLAKQTIQPRAVLF